MQLHLLNKIFSLSTLSNVIGITIDFRAFFSLILILISPLHDVSCAEKASINGRSVLDESAFCIRFDDDSDKCIFASGEFNNSRKNTNWVVSATGCSNCTRLLEDTLEDNNSVVIVQTCRECESTTCWSSAFTNSIPVVTIYYLKLYNSNEQFHG